MTMASLWTSSRPQWHRIQLRVLFRYWSSRRGRPSTLPSNRKSKFGKSKIRGPSVLRLEVAAHEVTHRLGDILAFVQHRMDLVDDRRHDPVFARQLECRACGGVTLGNSEHAGSNIFRFFAAANTFAETSIA